VVAQIAVDHHAFHAIERGGNPPGRKLLITPANRSAQSLGRKVFPAWVMPWMKTSLEVGETIGV